MPAVPAVPAVLSTWLEINPHPDKLIDWIDSEVRNDKEASVNFQHLETFRVVSCRRNKKPELRRGLLKQVLCRDETK